MKKAVLICFFFSFLCACEKNCTDILQVFTIQVQRADGTPVRLNRHFTLSNAGDTLVHEKLDSTMQYNTTTYTLLLSSDLQASETVTFTGMIDDSVVTQQSFSALHDECRIYEVNGPEPIVVP